MYSYAALRRRTDQYHAMVLARVRRLCKEGGLPDDVSESEHRRILAAFDNAGPRLGFDYAKLRQAFWLRRHRLWAAHMLLIRLVLRGRTDLGRSAIASKETRHALTTPLSR